MSQKHLDRFSHFCRSHSRDRPTDRWTDHTICNNRPHLGITAMWYNNLILIHAKSVCGPPVVPCNATLDGCLYGQTSDGCTANKPPPPRRCRRRDSTRATIMRSKSVACNINTMIMFMVLISWRGHCESSPGSFDEYRMSTRWLPTLKPSQPTWTVSPPVGCYHSHPPSPFIIITQHLVHKNLCHLCPKGLFQDEETDGKRANPDSSEKQPLKRRCCLEVVAVKIFVIS